MVRKLQSKGKKLVFAYGPAPVAMACTVISPARDTPAWLSHRQRFPASPAIG